ncbi:hypothetical protein M569_14915, partial [Genlisea aurea]
GGGDGYAIPASRFSNEDILFCIDVGQETMSEMKVTGSGGRPFTRLDAIKQAIMLFLHAKVAINPDHRYALCALSKSLEWVRKEFSSDVDSAIAALRGLTVDMSSSYADLTHLFKVANHEAKKSRSQSRIFRLILIYCRSSTPPQYQLPPSSQKLFTLDVLYLHDKPGPDNCPQVVYDTLVEALEQVSEYEGYIFEMGQGLMRTIFRNMALLLSHPQQRCLQDDLDLPKSLVKKSVTGETSQGDEGVVV